MNLEIQIIAFASLVYWKEAERAKEYVKQLQDNLGLEAEIKLVRSHDDLAVIVSDLPETKKNMAVFIPLSGGIQPLMLAAQKSFEFIGLFNAYLGDDYLSRQLIILNAHPSCTDFYAWCRMNRQDVFWLSSEVAFKDLLRAWKASCKFTGSTILKIGETEPWVINSCREPQEFAKCLNIKVILIDSERFYARVNEVSDDRVAEIAEDWQKNAVEVAGVDRDRIFNACRVYIAISDLMKKYNACGVSLACFAMAKDMQTTGCLALSMLNASQDFVGACEGDLEAAVSLLLMKNLGNDFVWVANPIIRDNGIVDLVHCTAPCAQMLYKLLPHHETGCSVATEVDLPGDETMSLMRIGNKLRNMVCHVGTSSKISKLPSCHTQIRIKVKSSEDLLENLMGTHFIAVYGDQRNALAYCSAFTGINFYGDSVDMPQE